VLPFLQYLIRIFDRPSEICAINPATAGFYTFLEGGIMKGPEDVLREFQNSGLAHVGIQWVQNHWKMILWKLASIVRMNHHLFSEKWNYREVVRQLKYRYVTRLY
jgi:breast cancer 2 susceptibility protein